jgi:hypothetical protein
MGSFPLLGLDRTSWDNEYEPDLVAITPRETPEPFLKWLAENIILSFHHRFWKRFKV